MPNNHNNAPFPKPMAVLLCCRSKQLFAVVRNNSLELKKFPCERRWQSSTQLFHRTAAPRQGGEEGLGRPYCIGVATITCTGGDLSCITKAIHPHRGLPHSIGHCFATHRAKAGPGLFAQDTVSVSPFFVIEIAPCGQVTEASVSPGAHTKLQPDPLSQLSAVTT